MLEAFDTIASGLDHPKVWRVDIAILRL